MLHEVKFPSSNGRDTVYGWIYVPACEARGIVQLVHGFGEHSRRYLHMIVALMDAGYIVAADDHVGHGKTALENGTWGDWGSAGWHTMMEDEHLLRELVGAKYPGLPYFMFGHSMGSFIARDYTAKYGSELSGAVYCGTAGTFKGLAEGMASLKALVDAGRGDEADPAAAAGLLGWLGERCGEIRLGNEWICHDPFVQADHAADPFDAFTRSTNNRSLYYFCQMMEGITGTEWAQRVPGSLPLYVISGDQDPVGNYGEGVYEVVNWLASTVHDVRTKLYCGYRHEIHNYADLRCEVEQGIVDFLNAHL